MFKFTKTSITYYVTIIIFIVIQILIHQYDIESEINEEIMNIDNISESPAIDNTKKWTIEIPKISLTANIAEGTTEKVLNQYVGHFESTPKEKGNIVLGTYNRLHIVNYFKDLKKLKQGDEIKYTYNEYSQIYEIVKCRIIKKTDLKYLENTEENMLTLITFIKNQPLYRRCIQAVEKE